MGLKGYRLWDMGQLEFNLQSPTERGVEKGERGVLQRLDVALQLHFERRILKPFFSLDRS
jgi:hypothetical protein